MNINLFCFPFAGGSIYSYLKYKNAAPPHINIIPLEPPGRGKRITEPLLTSIHEIADDMFNQLKPMLNEPYALYGHSIGTVVAYLITRRIINEELNKPLYLFVSGRVAPSVKDSDPINFKSSKNELRKKLREMGGVPDELLQDENIMDFFEPILRADIQAIEEYEYEQPDKPLDIPILAMIGREERITPELAMTWQKETSAQTDIHWFNGGHFFIFDHPVEIMRIITNKLQSVNANY